MVSVFRYPLLVALVTLLSLAGSVKAQWQIVGPAVFTSNDPQKGCSITYCDGVVWAGGHSLWRSDDLGLTWQACPSFPTVSSVLLISFFDKLHGYVLADFQTYLTSDGGATWKLLPFRSSRWGAYSANVDTFYFTCSGEFDILIKGASLEKVVGTQWIAPVASAKGIVYYLDNGILHRSQDGAATWTSGTMSENDCNALTIDSCDNNTLYLVNEEIFIPNDNITGILVSHDAGATWTMKNRNGKSYYAGNLANSSGAVYTGTIDGVLRSTDNGETWVPIGGPLGPPDNSALCVADDRVLLALDALGHLWRTTNDGNNPYHSLASVPQLLTAPKLFATDTLDLCDSVAYAYALSTASCHSPLLTKAEIVGADAAAYSLQTFSSTADSCAVSFHPQQSGKTDATLHLIYGSDTVSVTLAGVARSAAPTLANAKDTLFKTTKLYTCQQPVLDSTRVILNCNHRKITSATVTGGDAPNYVITRSGHNALTDQDTFFVTFHPSIAGRSNGMLSITYDDGTVLSVPLLGEGLENPNASVTTYNVQLKDTLGALVRVPIIVRHDNSLAAIEFGMSFDTSLLVFDRFASSTDSSLIASALAPGMQFLHAQMQADTADTLYAYFYWYPTTDSVTFDSIVNIRAIAFGDGCTVDINSSTTSRIAGPIHCETSLLTYFLRYGDAPYVSIRPNPANGSVEIESNLVASSLVLQDALGRIVANYKAAPKVIDVAALPAGLYYLRLQSGATTVTKPLIVAH